MKISKILTFILILSAFGAGFWFKDDIIRTYQSASWQVNEFKKTEIGTIISEAGKEIFTPAPLNVGGEI